LIEPDRSDDDALAQGHPLSSIARFRLTTRLAPAALRLTKEAPHRALNCLIVRPDDAFPGDEYHVPPRGDQVAHQANGFACQSFGSVADNRITNVPANGKPKSAVIQTVWRFAQNQHPVGPTLALCIHLVKISGTLETIALR